MGTAAPGAFTTGESTDITGGRKPNKAYKNTYRNKFMF